ncbi:MAG TPA: hypothetical protein VLA36_14930 [Longimicrobiales bacterium]|nr:hypothetical protein [Longimicrobiales bacterium]
MTEWGWSTRALKVRRGASPPLALLAMSLLAFPSAAAGQSVRGWVGTTVQAVELRPLGIDTIPRSMVASTADGFVFEGRYVSCPSSQICTDYVALDKDHLVAATQDLSLTAWGFGVEGLSFTTLLRTRAHAGGDLVWPRSGDAFDAILGYAQLVRGPLQLRAGRQDLRTGLGFAGFDGAHATYTWARVQMEAYVGRSLARGLREPANEALRALDDFFFDESVVLYGAAARTRLNATTLTARYHREILTDWSSLVGERASLDFNTILPDLRITGSLDYDFSFQRFGKGHVTFGKPAADGHVLLEATARRYVPYFQLNTIWGFFEPVSYSEIEMRAGWSPRSTVGLWASGGWRDYGKPDPDGVLFPSLRDHGWRANAGARWQPKEDWTLDGTYRLEWSPGGSLNSGDVAVRYQPTDRFGVSASATTFEQIEEFRIGEGRAYGGGLSFDAQVLDRLSFAGGVSVLRHTDGDSAFTSPWDQTRGWTSLRISIGEDPGMANRRNRR